MSDDAIERLYAGIIHGSARGRDTSTQKYAESQRMTRMPHAKTFKSAFIFTILQQDPLASVLLELKSQSRPVD